jgi:hypothetical protein
VPSKAYPFLIALLGFNTPLLPCFFVIYKSFSTSFCSSLLRAHDHVNILIQETINGYNNIGDGDPIQHEDRIKWINEKLSKRIKP